MSAADIVNKLLEVEDFDPREYLLSQPGSFIVHPSGENSTYGDWPYRNDYLVYSDNMDETREFEGYVRELGEGRFVAILKPEKSIAEPQDPDDPNWIVDRTQPFAGEQWSEPFATAEEAAKALIGYNRQHPKIQESDDFDARAYMLDLPRTPFGELEVGAYFCTSEQRPLVLRKIEAKSQFGPGQVQLAWGRATGYNPSAHFTKWGMSDEVSTYPPPPDFDPLQTVTFEAEEDFNARDYLLNDQGLQDLRDWLGSNGFKRSETASNESWQRSFWYGPEARVVKNRSDYGVWEAPDEPGDWIFQRKDMIHTRQSGAGNENIIQQFHGTPAQILVICKKWVPSDRHRILRDPMQEADEFDPAAYLSTTPEDIHEFLKRHNFEQDGENVEDFQQWMRYTKNHHLYIRRQRDDWTMHVSAVAPDLSSSMETVLEGKNRIMAYLQQMPDLDTERLRCPECRSTSLSLPDEEGLVDCMGCGIWFLPDDPNNAHAHVQEADDFSARDYLLAGSNTYYCYVGAEGEVRAWVDHSGSPVDAPVDFTEQEMEERKKNPRWAGVLWTTAKGKPIGEADEFDAREYLLGADELALEQALVARGFKQTDENYWVKSEQEGKDQDDSIVHKEGEGKWVWRVYLMGSHLGGGGQISSKKEGTANEVLDAMEHWHSQRALRLSLFSEAEDFSARDYLSSMRAYEGPPGKEFWALFKEGEYQRAIKFPKFVAFQRFVHDKNLERDPSLILRVRQSNDEAMDYVREVDGTYVVAGPSEYRERFVDPEAPMQEAGDFSARAYFMSHLDLPGELKARDFSAPEQKDGKWTKVYPCGYTMGVLVRRQVAVVYIYGQNENIAETFHLKTGDMDLLDRFDRMFREAQSYEEATAQIKQTRGRRNAGDPVPESVEGEENILQYVLTTPVKPFGWIGVSPATKGKRAAYLNTRRPFLADVIGDAQVFKRRSSLNGWPHLEAVPVYSDPRNTGEGALDPYYKPRVYNFSRRHVGEAQEPPDDFDAKDYLLNAPRGKFNYKVIKLGGGYGPFGCEIFFGDDKLDWHGGCADTVEAEGLGEHWVQWLTRLDALVPYDPIEHPSNMRGQAGDPSWLDWYSKAYSKVYPSRRPQQESLADDIAKEADKAEEPKSKEQADAGTYKKGHINLNGFEISIENAKGSVRKSKDPDNPWQVTMPSHYGYIKGTKGKDKDALDVYIGEHPTALLVYVVNQNKKKNPDQFDEHKVMMGFASKDEAVEAYDKAFNGDLGPKLRDDVFSVTVDHFKRWVEKGDMQKPFKPLEEARARKIVKKLLDEPFDAREYLLRDTDAELANLIETGVVYLSGSVTRTGHHYYHQRTTTLSVQVNEFNWPEGGDPDAEAQEEARIDGLVGKFEQVLGERIVDWNDKIYAELEAAYDDSLSEEVIAGTMEANNYEFTVDGEREDGTGIQYDQLSPEAKERARDWYIESSSNDDYWSEGVVLEWKWLLQQKGFEGVDIAWSGFSSQGDGASFTAKSIDFITLFNGPDPLEFPEQNREQYVGESEDFNAREFLQADTAWEAILSQRGYDVPSYAKGPYWRWVKEFPNGSSITAETCVGELSVTVHWRHYLFDIAHIRYDGDTRYLDTADEICRTAQTIEEFEERLKAIPTNVKDATAINPPPKAWMGPPGDMSAGALPFGGYATESAQPFNAREFFLSTPTKYNIQANGRDGQMLYYSSPGGWSASQHHATQYTEEEAERMMAELRRLGLVYRETKLVLVPTPYATEARFNARDYLLSTPPEPKFVVGYQRRNLYYGRSGGIWNRLEHAIQMSEQEAKDLAARYAANGYKVDIIPVSESALGESEDFNAREYFMSTEDFPLTRAVDISDEVWKDDHKLRRLFSWQTRIGIAPKYGTTSIANYQSEQIEKIDALKVYAHQKGIGPLKWVRYRNGVIYAYDAGKWMPVANVAFGHLSQVLSAMNETDTFDAREYLTQTTHPLRMLDVQQWGGILGALGFRFHPHGIPHWLKREGEVEWTAEPASRAYGDMDAAQVRCTAYGHTSEWKVPYDELIGFFKANHVVEAQQPESEFDPREYLLSVDTSTDAIVDKLVKEFGFTEGPRRHRGPMKNVRSLRSVDRRFWRGELSLTRTYVGDEHNQTWAVDWYPQAPDYRQHFHSGGPQSKLVDFLEEFKAFLSRGWTNRESILGAASKAGFETQWINNPARPPVAESKDWVPKDYKLDDEFGCLTNAENLAKVNPELRYVEGWTRIRGTKKWGAHAWCVAPDGTIVDPYFKCRFSDDWQNVEYREDANAFDRGFDLSALESVDDFSARDYLLSGNSPVEAELFRHGFNVEEIHNYYERHMGRMHVECVLWTAGEEAEIKVGVTEEGGEAFLGYYKVSYARLAEFLDLIMPVVAELAPVADQWIFGELQNNWDYHVGNLSDYTVQEAEDFSAREYFASMPADYIVKWSFGPLAAGQHKLYRYTHIKDATGKENAIQKWQAKVDRDYPGTAPDKKPVVVQVVRRGAPMNPNSPWWAPQREVEEAEDFDAREYLLTSQSCRKCGRDFTEPESVVRLYGGLKGNYSLSGHYERTLFKPDETPDSNLPYDRLGEPFDVCSRCGGAVKALGEGQEEFDARDYFLSIPAVACDTCHADLTVAAAIRRVVELRDNQSFEQWGHAEVHDDDVRVFVYDTDIPEGYRRLSIAHVLAVKNFCAKCGTKIRRRTEEADEFDPRQWMKYLKPVVESGDFDARDYFLHPSYKLTPDSLNGIRTSGGDIRYSFDVEYEGKPLGKTYTSLPAGYAVGGWYGLVVGVEHGLAESL